MPVISSCSLYFWVIQWNLRMSSPWRAFAEVSQCPWVCPFSIFAHFQQKALTLNNAVLSLGYMGGNYLHTSLGVIPFLGWHDKCFSISDLFLKLDAFCFICYRNFTKISESPLPRFWQQNWIFSNHFFFCHFVRQGEWRGYRFPFWILKKGHVIYMFQFWNLYLAVLYSFHIFAISYPVILCEHLFSCVLKHGYKNCFKIFVC